MLIHFSKVAEECIAYPLIFFLSENSLVEMTIQFLSQACLRVFYCLVSLFTFSLYCLFSLKTFFFSLKESCLFVMIQKQLAASSNASLKTCIFILSMICQEIAKRRVVLSVNYYLTHQLKSSDNVGEDCLERICQKISFQRTLLP